MIKIEELREFMPIIHIKDGQRIDLPVIKQTIEIVSKEREISVAFYNEQVKSGGLFNKKIEDCIVLYHPEHIDDYFKFAIRVAYQGTYAIVAVNDFGYSRQFAKENRNDLYKESRRGQSMSFKVGSLIGQGINSIGRNKHKFEEEQAYYACLMSMLEEVFA